MDLVLIALRLLLAAVFATAAVGKLLDRPGSREALGEFGVPDRLRSAGVVVLPAAELAVAIALLLTPVARWGALGALMLLGVFIAGIAAALARGRAPECHCFGQIHSEPAGKATLMRNLVLAAAAAVVVGAGPGRSISGWISDRSAGELAAIAGGAVALAALLVTAMRWYRGRAAERARLELDRPAGLPPGAPAPDFDLGSKLCGCPATLEALTAPGLPVLLVFVHPDCGPCTELLPQVGRWQTSLFEQLTIAIVTQGDWERNMATQAEHNIYNVLVEPATDVYTAYGMRGTPSAVVVSPDRTIASATARGPLEIEALVRQTLRRTALRGLAMAQ